MITPTPRFGGTFTFTAGVKYPRFPEKSIAQAVTKGNTVTVTLKPVNPKNYRTKAALLNAEKNLDESYLMQCKSGNKQCDYQGPLNGLTRLVAQFSPSP